MRDHTLLKAYALADELVLEIYKITKAFPKEEIFGLTSQMHRSAVSVPSNIVEGCSRESQNEYCRFLEIAFGSLRELHYQLDLACRLGFANDLEFSQLEKKCIETEKVLGALIRKMRRDKLA
jgi:four helix bundle protein